MSDKDLNLAIKEAKNIIDEESSDLSCILVYKVCQNENGIVYYDWNVASSDAVPNPLPKEQIYNNVMSGIAQKDVSVVLMHDAAGKETTVEATRLIIESLQEMNALILPITNETVPVHHNIDN